MKTTLSFTVLGLFAAALAQGPLRGTPSQGPANGPSSANSTSRNSNASANIPTETIRVLTLSSVQKEISMTSDEYSILPRLAPTLPAATTSEDQAFGSVSRVLTSTQTSRLEELLVQDLGYGAVALSDVRMKLGLSTDQTMQITGLLSTLESAKKAIIGLNTDANRTKSAVSQVAASANQSIEAALTADQRSKLQSLAGKNLGSSE